MPFNMYRQDQGKRARMVAFSLLGLLGFYVSYAFFTNPAAWVSTPLFKVGSFDVCVSHMGSAVLALIFIAAIYFMIVRSKRSVDFLIETDAEMGKVSWPSSADVRSSAVVVLVTIVILSFFIFVFDMFFAWLMTMMVGA